MLMFLARTAANIPRFFIMPKKYREILLNKFSVFFDYLPAMCEELLLVGGGEVYPCYGAAPISKPLYGGCHLGRSEFGCGTQELYPKAFFIGVGAFKEVGIAGALEEV